MCCDSALFSGRFLCVITVDSLRTIFTRRGLVSLICLSAAFLAACDHASSGAEGGPDQAGDTSVELAAADDTKVRLDAFRDFKCSSNWVNRDGALGLKAGTGSGACEAGFPGRSGRYRVTLMAQLEFDGAPEYRIAVDGETIAAGAYPLSKGKLICDCPNWRINCPDRVVPIDAGVHQLKTGSKVEFFGAEVYPCGKHGAYAKWRELVFTPN